MLKALLSRPLEAFESGGDRIMSKRWGGALAGTGVNKAFPVARVRFAAPEASYHA